jgi:hypothetical protein
MELKDFIKKVLTDLDNAVIEASQASNHNISFSDNKDRRTVEFDIAVTTEDVDVKSGKTGIKVLQFIEAGGNISVENKNSTVSRITFGVHIDSMTKRELQEMHDRNDRIVSSQNSDY